MRFLSTVDSPIQWISTVYQNEISNLWVFRLELVLNPFLHSGHMWGFSPVWVLMCLFRRLGLSNVLPHTEHGNIVFSFGLLPGPVLGTLCWPMESKDWPGMGATDKIFDMMPPLGLMFGNIKLNVVAGDGNRGSLCGSRSGLIPYSQRKCHEI